MSGARIPATRPGPHVIEQSSSGNVPGHTGEELLGVLVTACSVATSLGPECTGVVASLSVVAAMVVSTWTSLFAARIGVSAILVVTCKGAAVEVLANETRASAIFATSNLGISANATVPMTGPGTNVTATGTGPFVSHVAAAKTSRFAAEVVFTSITTIVVANRTRVTAVVVAT